MDYPKKQYVLARTRGKRTNYFYGTKLGDMVLTHVKVGDTFTYTTLTAGTWKEGQRMSDYSYSTAR